LAAALISGDVMKLFVANVLNGTVAANFNTVNASAVARIASVWASLAAKPGGTSNQVIAVAPRAEDPYFVNDAASDVGGNSLQLLQR
jgi:hypothetical protein